MSDAYNGLLACFSGLKSSKTLDFRSKTPVDKLSTGVLLLDKPKLLFSVKYL